jgi:hypothetical protein
MSSTRKHSSHGNGSIFLLQVLSDTSLHLQILYPVVTFRLTMKADLLDSQEGVYKPHLGIGCPLLTGCRHQAETAAHAVRQIARPLPWMHV